MATEKEAEKVTKTEPEATKTTSANVVKSEQQEQAEEASRTARKYYAGWPMIRGLVCEFCGVDYRKCEHYKAHFEGKGNFICLCGRSEDQMAVKQLSLLYVPHRGLFICDSQGCEKKYNDSFGGFERLVSWHFFRREVPLYGSLLSDPVQGTKL